MTPLSGADRTILDRFRFGELCRLQETEVAKAYSKLKERGLIATERWTDEGPIYKTTAAGIEALRAAGR
ncbi:hypothetical protein [Pseudoroseomonas cervicalis]|uniref:hypothetical protein n=1 Tax=Teichococcus cervicalis TaxID=204525 RepID=UPI00278B1E37|nr:hypothetical protein [Pseudoroseomonas cervicalis]MDQ1077993.1 DNA-binding PadR family transcriptional regulator [Pseudoroseomonas cervicalis]